MAMSLGTARLSGRAALFSLSLLASASAGRAAEFLDYYKLGLAAVESQQWGQAAELMQKAIDRQPSERARIKKSLFFRRYLPHFYLGAARFESGDCSGALTAWSESERQGVVAKFPEFQRIQEGRAACRKIGELQVALDAALQAVERADAAATASRRQLSLLPSSEGSVAGLQDRQTEAEATLDRGRQRLGSADITLSEVEEIAAVAVVVRDEFLAIARELQSERRAQVDRRREELTARLQVLEDRARQLLTESRSLQPYPPQVERQRVLVEQVLARTAADDLVALNIGELRALRTDLEGAIQDLRRVSAPPPEPLQAAAAAYLKRDYERVLDVLAEQDFRSARAASHAHLLQAAALFALYRVGGSSDQELLDRATGQVAACHEVDPQRSPPTSVFPPDFVAFFESQSAAPGPATDESDESEGP